MILECLVLTAAGFFCGSLMFSYYIPKILKNVDVREVSGDRNPGSSNAIRAAGPAIGLGCMALDVLKAYVPVFYAVTVSGLRGFLLVPVILAPSLGHAFSPFLGFRGGKSVSTTFGSLLAIWPLSKIVLLLALTLAFFKFVAVVRPDSSGVILSMGVSSIIALFAEPLPGVKAAYILLSVLLIARMLGSPDKGGQSVNVWRYSLTYEGNKLRLHKL